MIQSIGQRVLSDGKRMRQCETTETEQNPAAKTN